MRFIYLLFNYLQIFDLKILITQKSLEYARVILFPHQMLLWCLIAADNFLSSKHGRHSRYSGLLCFKNLGGISNCFTFKFVHAHTMSGRYISKLVTESQKRSFYSGSWICRTFWKLPCRPWVARGFQACCLYWCENSSSSGRSSWCMLSPWTSLQILAV